MGYTTISDRHCDITCTRGMIGMINSGLWFADTMLNLMDATDIINMQGYGIQSAQSSQIAND